MYAIVELGSAQYKVSEGDTINTNRLDRESGKSFKIEKVLLFADGNKIEVGQPYLKDVKVTATVVKELRGPKTAAVKFRRRKGSRQKIGHRQDLSAVNITKIEVK